MTDGFFVLGVSFWGRLPVNVVTSFVANSRDLTGSSTPFDLALNKLKMLLISVSSTELSVTGGV